MQLNKFFSVSFWATLLGVAFSGYLSGIKFFNDTCAFSEPCPTFLGYPACYFGFAMFSTMFLISIVGLISPKKFLVWLVSTVSLLGIVFAGYFTIPEIGRLMAGTTNYSLGLPTCSYGLIFFILIFILSIFGIKGGKAVTAQY